MSLRDTHNSDVEKIRWARPDTATDTDFIAPD